MKTLLPLLAVLGALTLQAQDALEMFLEFKSPLTVPVSGVTLKGNIEVADHVTGKWTTPKISLVQSGDTFSGSFENSIGLVNVTGQFVPKGGGGVTCILNWQAPTSMPPLVFIANLYFPQGSLAGAAITAGPTSIPFSKVESKEAQGIFLGVSSFVLGPVDGTNLTFVFGEPTKVEAVFYKVWNVRFFVGGSAKDPVPATGSISFDISAN